MSPAPDWLNDDDIVFGIEVNGEYRAYPRQIMEVREMVNDTLGGRDLGIPYCTLCGSAQAYFTDDVPEGVERPVLRTSGLLIRSNKVMYDLNNIFGIRYISWRCRNRATGEKKCCIETSRCGNHNVGAVEAGSSRNHCAGRVSWRWVVILIFAIRAMPMDPSSR